LIAGVLCVVLGSVAWAAVWVQCPATSEPNASGSTAANTAPPAFDLHLEVDFDAEEPEPTAA
jgi:hypothetical protein